MHPLAHCPIHRRRTLLRTLQALLPGPRYLSGCNEPGKATRALKRARRYIARENVQAASCGFAHRTFAGSLPGRSPIACGNVNSRHVFPPLWAKHAAMCANVHQCARILRPALVPSSIGPDSAVRPGFGWRLYGWRLYGWRLYWSPVGYGGGARALTIIRNRTKLPSRVSTGGGRSRGWCREGRSYDSGRMLTRWELGSRARLSL